MKKSVIVFILLIAAAIQSYAQESQGTFTIYFDHDSYSLSEESRKTLNSVIDYTTGRSEVKISCFGYTDDSGTVDHNKILAANRANAAKDYLEKGGLFVGTIGGFQNNSNKAAPPEKQRRVLIVVTSDDPGTATTGNGYSPREFKGPNGTIVVANVKNGSEGAIEVEEFFTPESMIENRMFAIDSKGRLLQTDGMIEICNDGKTLDPDGKTYTVKMPANRGKINRSMTIWLSVADANGEIRWQNTTIDITTDPEEKYYIFKVPAGTQNCVRVNLDMPVCGTPDNKGGLPVAVYVEMFKPYDFFDVRITSPYNDGKEEKNYLPFSAKLNRQRWAFTAKDGAYINDMQFTGRYYEEGGVKTYTSSLLNAKYKYNKKDRSHHFYIRPVKQKKNVAAKKETGFWAWVKRQFS